MTAEYRVKTEARGRVVDEWKPRTGNPDNHWFDYLVGCAVAASIKGAVLFGTDVKEARQRQRLKLSELQRARRRSQSTRGLKNNAASSAAGAGVITSSLSIPALEKVQFYGVENAGTAASE